MKKRIIIISCIILAILLGLFLLTGTARTDVYLKDFNIDPNSSTMTLKIGVASSAGYVRDLKIKQGGDNKYITFYSTFGINSKLGAADTFEISLNNSCTEIYFYTGGKGYTKVLEKDENGIWTKVTNK